MADNTKVEEWLCATTSLVVERVRDRPKAFQEKLAKAPEDEELLKKAPRYSKLTEILAEHDNQKAASPQKKSRLKRIIRGYLIEFIRQTEEQIPDCNIEAGRNEAARTYWAERPSNEFEQARMRGAYHTVFSANAVRNGAKVGRLKALEATGEIIFITTRTFREKYPELDSEKPPIASVFNDFAGLTLLGYELRNGNHSGQASPSR